jgi:cation diffusion facilitator family transporter
VATLLAVVSFEFLVDSVEKLNNRESANFGKWAIIVTVISIISKELMAQFSFFASKKINSKSLKADGWHHRSDAISSLVILIGIFLGDKFWWMDSVLGMIVSALILYTAYEILKESSGQIIGEEPDQNIVDKIHEYSIEFFGKDMNIHHVHLHSYGDHIEMTFHMVFDSNFSIKKAHDMATLLENKIYERLNIYTTIHMEPNSHIEDIS